MAGFRIVSGLAVAVLGLALTAAPSFGQETTRVSVDSSGMQGDRESRSSAISADGQIVAFESQATNLVAGDTNRRFDVFVYDRSTGLIERVSVDSAGAQGDRDSFDPSISANGQFVAFWSVARNLVPGDTNHASDVFVHDRVSGLTERVSVDSSGVQGNGESYEPAISADGQVVAFSSGAGNLVAGDIGADWDIFVHDRSTGFTERVSVDSMGVEGNSGSYYPSISGDGQIVAFYSYAWNLVFRDWNGTYDVFVHDRSTGITERVSVDSSGVEGNYRSLDPAISADGNLVAFHSWAWNLVPGDTNWPFGKDIFVHDRSTGMTERVSVDSSGAEGNSNSYAPAISADGQIVTFWSSASNLVTGDTNGGDDVFIHDRSTGLTERMSVATSGAEANAQSEDPSISANGLVVAFDSWATNLAGSDTNFDWDVFVHERCAVDATWSNYGAGFPGTAGVPAFTSQADPVLGATLTLDLANSYGTSTAGLLFVGFQRTSIHSSWGGELLVVPLLTIVIGLPPGGTSFIGDIPIDHDLCGTTIDLQAIEFDPGAAKGVSFTAGLELVLGH